MQIVRFIALFGAVLCGQIFAKETKTFPGAEIIIPAIIGQVIPAIVGGITGGGIGGILPPLPPVPPISASHTTAVATSIANKPIAISHSGTISTASSTNAGSQASVGSASGLISASSNAGSGTKVVQNFSKRWQKFFKRLG